MESKQNSSTIIDITVYFVQQGMHKQSWVIAAKCYYSYSFLSRYFSSEFFYILFIEVQRFLTVFNNITKYIVYIGL